MASMIRKKMKKSHYVLWVVLVSLVLGMVSSYFLRIPGSGDVVVGTVNSRTISAHDYKRAYADLQARLSFLQQYAGMYGSSYELLLKTFLGSTDIPSLAVENAVKNSLVDQVVDNLGLDINQDIFKEDLVQSLPQGIVNEIGFVDMDVYNRYVERMGLTPAEFEAGKKQEFKRNLLSKVVGAADYTPAYVYVDELKQQGMKKSFKIVTFDYDSYLKKEKNITFNNEEIREYFDKNKEQYKTPEKRQYKYFILSPAHHQSSFVIEESAIQTFYDKNKSTMFKTSPKVSVRRIFIAAGKDTVVARKKIESIMNKLIEDPSLFTSLAIENSTDKESAKKGGLVDLFSRGTYGPEFEKAAFKLQVKGEISDIITTDEGFEILQLEERRNGVEKSIAEVREEIIKTLRMKKATASIKSDLEHAMHNGKEDVTVLESLASKYEAKIKQSDLLVEVDNKNKENGLEEKLKERAFGKSASAKKMGFFLLDNNYVAYWLIKLEEKTIPAFKEIQAEVTKDFQEERAKDVLKNAVKDIKAKVYRKEVSLEVLAKENNLSIIETGLITKKENVDKLKDFGFLQAKLFSLTSSTQLLEYRHKNNIYLAQLIDVQSLSKEEEADIFESAKKEMAKKSGFPMKAFIASLQRNAKIDIKKQVINAYKRN